MQIGDVVSTKAFKAIIQEGAGFVEYKAMQGKCMVFLCLGGDDIKNPQMNSAKFEAIMNAMGWQKTPGMWVEPKEEAAPNGSDETTS